MPGDGNQIPSRYTDKEMFGELVKDVVFIEERKDAQGEKCCKPYPRLW
jgi:hypothetical protein